VPNSIVLYIYYILGVFNSVTDILPEVAQTRVHKGNIFTLIGPKLFNSKGIE